MRLFFSFVYFLSFSNHTIKSLSILPLSYGKYFPLYSPLSHPSLTLIHYLNHHLSVCPIKLLLQFFLSDDLLGNTIQRSTSHKCGYKSRYNAFNVVVAAFLQIFRSLPFSQCVCEVSLHGENFVENHYNGPSKQLNRIQ